MAEGVLEMAFVCYNHLKKILETNDELKKTATGISSTMAEGVLEMAFVYYNHLKKILETNDELKKTATGIFNQVVLGAVGTVAGGAAKGPVGAIVGGLAGSVMGYCMSDEYQPMTRALAGLTDEKKWQLVSQVKRLVGSALLEALTCFIGTQDKREVLLNLLNKFTTDLHSHL
ncbi:uncharacterized protein LOC125378209 isoform X2 [Haliotis rufescens]|nr:uncharacterized protein LOC125378209 isoform X2 [Haliotis rufescens]